MPRFSPNWFKLGLHPEGKRDHWSRAQRAGLLLLVSIPNPSRSFFGRRSDGSFGAYWGVIPRGEERLHSGRHQILGLLRLLLRWQPGGATPAGGRCDPIGSEPRSEPDPSVPKHSRVERGEKIVTWGETTPLDEGKNLMHRLESVDVNREVLYQGLASAAVGVDPPAAMKCY